MKNLPIIIGSILGLAVMGAFTGWAVYAGSKIGGGWSSLEPIWPFVAGGVLVVAALTGGLMWLAFHSANRGYDDRPDHF